jgi:ABC-type sugar transport system ATPase subunit
VIDVGAKIEIYHLINEVAKGVGVIVISSDSCGVWNCRSNSHVQRNYIGELQKENSLKKNILRIFHWRRIKSINTNIKSKYNENIYK